MFLSKIFYLLFIYINILFLVKSSSHIKISIIIPIYNTEPYLKRSIQSVINQTLEDIEIICIDDASTDNSLSILNDFKNIDNRIRVIQLEENKGPSICRNIGINVAYGEFIGFIDSDDYIDKRYFENLYNYSKDYDVVVGTFVRSNNDSDEFIYHRNFTRIEGYVWDSIFRREFLDSNNLRFPTHVRVQEDRLFRNDCYQYKPRIFYTPDEGIYYYYKQRKGSLCSYNRRYLRKLSKNLKRISKKKRKNN